MYFRFALCCLLVFFVSALHAQKNILSQDQDLLWTRYYLQLNFSPKVFWNNEADNRVFLKNFHQNQFIFHSHVHYRFNENVEASTGVSYSYQKPANPDVVNPLGVPERRMFQELYFRQNLSNKLKLQHRLRCEERFFRRNNGIILTDGYDFNWRYRYQIQLSYAISPSFTAKVSNELMLNFGKKIIYNTFDQNRIYAAIEGKISKNFSAELGYMRYFQQRAKANEYILRDNIRFTLYHRLNLYKK